MTKSELDAIFDKDRPPGMNDSEWRAMKHEMMKIEIKAWTLPHPDNREPYGIKHFVVHPEQKRT